MVHQYKLNGYNIVIDVCSGGIHVVDDIAYDIIEKFEKQTRDEVISSVFEKYSTENNVTKEEIEKVYTQIVDMKKYM